VTGTAGLDFGTTTTLLATSEGVVPLGKLRAWLPSLIGFDDDGSVLVGEEADEAAPGQTIRSVKRAITKRWNTVRDAALVRAGTVIADELIVDLLRAVGDRAWERGLDLADAGSVAVGCPAVWDGGQRRRLVSLLNRAGIAAGVSDLVDEPVAAGIAWLVEQPRTATPMRLLVFDMGGGTLDLAVIDVRGPDDRDVYLLAAVGRAEAGDALDEAIAADLARDLRVDELTQHRRELLLDAARRLKERLSDQDEDVAVLRREEFPAGNEAWYDRPRLEAALAPQLDRAMESVLLALRIAYLTGAPDATPVSWPPDEDLLGGVDVVLLSGGMSQVPAVADRLRKHFPPRTTITLATDPPEQAVALGLTRAAPFRRNTRYALPYDIRLEWDEGQQSRVIYDAYMPILESWWIERSWDGELKFRCTGHGLALPDRGTAVLRTGGGDMDGHPVALNGERFELSIYPSGRIVLVDGVGTHEGTAR
jgi:molecular chaperone DnaK (HSP70)